MKSRPKAKRRQRKPFTFQIPVEKRRPRGPEHALDRAVDMLIAPNAGDTFAISRDAAKRLISNLASSYLEAEIRFERAPLVKEHIETLESLVGALKRLVEWFRSADDFTIFELQSALSCLNRNIQGLAQLDKLSPADRLQEEPLLISRLLAIEAVATAAIDNAKTIHSAAFKGGHINVLTALRQNPRQILASESLVLFENFSGLKASTNNHGKFHQFVDCVYEYATGLDPFVHAKMYHWIKVALNSRDPYPISHRAGRAGQPTKVQARRRRK